MQDAATPPLPQYQCHKKVWALKISKIRADFDHVGSEHFVLIFEDSRFAARTVPLEYFAKHAPKPGGYWVQYDDGYESWSPTEAFESGYTLITGERA